VSFDLHKGVYAECLTDNVDPVNSSQFLEEPMDPNSEEDIDRYKDVIKTIFDDKHNYFHNGGSLLEELNFIGGNNTENLTFLLEYRFPYKRYSDLPVEELGDVRLYLDPKGGKSDAVTGDTSGELIYLVSESINWSKRDVRSLFINKHGFFDENWVNLVGSDTLEALAKRLASGEDERLPQEYVERIYARIQNLGKAVRTFSDIEEKGLIPTN
jgi:hypothetical protein